MDALLDVGRSVPWVLRYGTPLIADAVATVLPPEEAVSIIRKLMDRVKPVFPSAVGSAYEPNPITLMAAYKTGDLAFADEVAAVSTGSLDAVYAFLAEQWGRHRAYSEAENCLRCMDTDVPLRRGWGDPPTPRLVDEARVQVAATALRQGDRSSAVDLLVSALVGPQPKLVVQDCCRGGRIIGLASEILPASGPQHLGGPGC